VLAAAILGAFQIVFPGHWIGFHHSEAGGQWPSPRVRHVIQAKSCLSETGSSLTQSISSTTVRLLGSTNITRLLE
jgi:hypothetical protein